MPIAGTNSVVLLCMNIVLCASFFLLWSRTSLPSPMFSRNDFSIWSVLKNCIGKELSKITMPVIFNEPLSFLQRMTEYMEYARLLRLAADQEDPIERMKYVAGKWHLNKQIPLKCVSFNEHLKKWIHFSVLSLRLCCISIGIELGTIGQTIQSIVGRDIRIPKWWFSNNLRTSVASSTCFSFSRWCTTFQIQRCYSSEIKVLGKERRNSTKRHCHCWTTKMEWGLHMVERQLLCS